MPAASGICRYPATYHNNACGLSFADGHSEIHKWFDDGNWIRPCEFTSGPYDLNVGPKDYTWVAEAAPRAIPCPIRNRSMV